MKKTGRNWTRYFVPGFLFQSVVIGGGYGTGAEIAQYFAMRGMLGGALGLMVTTLVWSLLCAVTFLFAQRYRTFDYHSLMKTLLGKWSFLYEGCYLTMLLIVLGVINATAGSMIGSLGFSPWLGVGILSGSIFWLVVKGTEAVEKALSFWSIVLYAVYALFLIAVFIKFGSRITSEIAKHQISGNWLMSGLQYSFYNLGVVPALLYTIRDMKDTREAAISGALAGLIGVIPALFLLLAMGCDLPMVVQAEVPVAAIFSMLHDRWLFYAFQIVLFGTLVETGTGYIKAVTDRVETAVRHPYGTTPAKLRPTVTAGLIIFGVGVSSFGLTGLVAKGYGTVCWGFLLAYVFPMLTVGVRKIWREKNERLLR